MLKYSYTYIFPPFFVHFQKGTFFCTLMFCYIYEEDRTLSPRQHSYSSRSSGCSKAMDLGLHTHTWHNTNTVRGEIKHGKAGVNVLGRKRNGDVIGLVLLMSGLLAGQWTPLLEITQGRERRKFHGSIFDTAFFVSCHSTAGLYPSWPRAKKQTTAS